MLEQRKLVVSHAPYWHNGSRVTTRSFHIMLAALPAVLFGLSQYGMPALSVVALSVSTAILWEIGFNKVTKGRITVGDGNAALIGLVFAMLVPATMRPFYPERSNRSAPSRGFWAYPGRRETTYAPWGSKTFTSRFSTALTAGANSPLTAGSW